MSVIFLYALLAILLQDKTTCMFNVHVFNENLIIYNVLRYLFKDGGRYTKAALYPPSPFLSFSFSLFVLAFIVFGFVFYIYVPVMPFVKMHRLQSLRKLARLNSRAL